MLHQSFEQNHSVKFFRLASYILLAKKLWESNIQFENDVELLATETVSPLIKELDRMTESICGTQLTIQIATSQLHVVNESFYVLDDILESIFSDQRIPDLVSSSVLQHEAKFDLSGSRDSVGGTVGEPA
ncbi:unnamed protein product [Soboliphyme baturini]|uniref:Biogenesis of lysosome-related organelles complex 1 subunit 3 n=1 Tax=Soboliphyme baturini TaxID=241478 RepID=A0A183J649_9BILA|nr:unnamed protein product [Soboliphyme baturini]